MHFQRKKLEFSKKILIVAGMINLAVIVFTMIMIAKTGDLTPLAYLIPSVAGEVATGTGFYYAKAKVENAIKLRKIYGIDRSGLTDAIQEYSNMEHM